MKMANPESKTFESYLAKVMNSVRNRKRMSLAPDSLEQIIPALQNSTSLPNAAEDRIALRMTD